MVYGGLFFLIFIVGYALYCWSNGEPASISGKIKKNKKENAELREKVGRLENKEPKLEGLIERDRVIECPKCGEPTKENWETKKPFCSSMYCELRHSIEMEKYLDNMFDTERVIKMDRDSLLPHEIIINDDVKIERTPLESSIVIVIKPKENSTKLILPEILLEEILLKNKFDRLADNKNE